MYNENCLLLPFVIYFILFCSLICCNSGSLIELGEAKLIANKQEFEIV